LDEKNKLQNPETISRRDFIRDAGIVVGAASVGAAALVGGCAAKEVTTTVTAPAVTVNKTLPAVTVTQAAAGVAVPKERMKRLEIGYVTIKKVQVGAATGISAGVLTVNADKLKAVIMKDARIGRCDVAVANPGDSMRIVRIAEQFEPVARTGTRKGQFPWPTAMGVTQNCGAGSIVKLQGAIVFVCNPGNMEQMRANQNLTPTDAGTFTQYNFAGEVGVLPASKLCAVAISIYPPKEYPYTRKPEPSLKPIYTNEEWQAALKLAGMRAAAYLGRAAENMTPEKVDVFEYPPVWGVPAGMEKLPKVVYVSALADGNRPCGIDACANTSEPRVYGGSGYLLQAAALHPNEYMDGAAVSSTPNDGYAIGNDPYVMEFHRRHGKDLNFLGVVMNVHHWEGSERMLIWKMTTDVVANVMGADGMIVWKTGGGAPHAGFAQLCKQMMSAGTKAVATNFGVNSIYTNPEPKFGTINTGGGISYTYPAVDNVFGFHWNIASPNKAGITGSANFPMQSRGGEMNTQIPAFTPYDDPIKGEPSVKTVQLEKTAAARGIDMLVAMCTGKPWTGELDVTGTQPPAHKAAPGIADIKKAKIAFVTGGGLVKIGEEPFAATGNVDGKFKTYDLTGLTYMDSKVWEFHHGGYTQHWSKADIQREIPLPELRQLLKEGAFGSFDETIYCWSSLGSKWVGSRLVGLGILPLLKAAGVQGVITDST
jgi:sarcosine reductase